MININLMQTDKQFPPDFMGFIKSFKNYLTKQYYEDFYVGSIYSDNNITYFPFTPKNIKEQKLKIAIVYNHQNSRFEIWLAGQNKQIQKQYWEIFKGSDWDKYHIPSSIVDTFSIVDSILIENPDFSKFDTLKNKLIEDIMDFIKEIEKVLVYK